MLEQPRSRGCERFVIARTSGPEQPDDVVVHRWIRRTYIEHRGLTALRLDLAPDPLEVLARLRAAGQHIRRIPQQHRAQALETTPDLHAYVGVFRGQK